MRLHRISSALLAGTAFAACATSLSAHTEISSVQAEQMILSGQELVVLDVREYSEFCGSYEHIEDAANLPWNSGVLASRFAEVASDETIIVVCASGGRSHQAATFLDGEGYTDIYDMQGGMSGWEYETESCDPAPVLAMYRDGSDYEINWSPAFGTQDYDLLRGLLSEIEGGSFFVDLGPADCLAEQSPYTYYLETETPLPGVTRFFLSRPVAGSWGRSSQDQERIPQTCD